MASGGALRLTAGAAIEIANLDGAVARLRYWSVALDDEELALATR